MEPFREGLGQPVGQGLDHDALVVVVLACKSFGERGCSQAGGHREKAHVVVHAAVRRGDEVGEAKVWVPGAFLGLLAEHVKPRNGIPGGALRTNLDVVGPGPAGGKKAEDAIGGNEIVANDLVEEDIRVLEKALGFLSRGGRVENVGIFSLELPGKKKRGPVDVGPQRLDRDGLEDGDAQFRRCGSFIAAPV